MRTISVKLFGILTSGHNMSFTDIFIFSSGGHLVQQVEIMYTNFGGGHIEEQFSEIILNLNQWFRSGYHSKIFLIYSSGGHLVRLKYFENWPGLRVK